MAAIMKMLLLTSSLFVTCFLSLEAARLKKKPPNFLFILMDDLGWRDFGVHDPNFVTPTIDRLYREGFRFNYSYTDPVGASSRASLLSGKFSFTMGLQDNAINKETKAYIPLNHTILPAGLKRFGYKTHMIGKWDQGFCNLDQTPNHRGFDTFYGQYTSGADYMSKELNGCFDFREDDLVTREKMNDYTTDLLTKRAIKHVNRHKKKFPNNEKSFFIMLSYTAIREPNQFPEKYFRKCRKGTFTTPKRKEKCAMMAAVDKGLWKIIRKLKKTAQLNNTIIIFTSDNGGKAGSGSSNWPLRGSKSSVWEGGIRVPTFMHSTNSALMPVMNHTYRGTFHVVDWFPTLIGFVKKRGRKIWPSKLAPPMDGLNHWRLIKRGVKKSFRQEFAYIVKEDGKDIAYVRQKDFKLVYNEQASQGWYCPPSNTSEKEIPSRNYATRPYFLFNIKKDPEEDRDLYRSKGRRNVEARQVLETLLASYRERYYPKITIPVDAAAAAQANGNVWGPFAC